MSQLINCYHCEQDKDISEYRPSKVKLHLFKGICIECCKIQNARNREIDKQKRESGISEPKTCSRCKETKDSILDYSPRASQCKICRHDLSVEKSEEINQKGREQREIERQEKYKQGLLDGTIPPEGYKFCRKCGETKLLEAFVGTVAPIKIKKMSTYATCKECRVVVQKEDWSKLTEKKCSKCLIVKDISKFSTCHSQCKECVADWRQENKEKNAEYQREHLKDPEIRRKRNITRGVWRKNKRANDPLFVIEKTLRDRLYHLVKSGKAKKQERAINLVGCTLEELKAHLESYWEPLMSWSNYGKPKNKGDLAWEIDHVVCCNFYDLLELGQQKECFHWKNLRPIWGHLNARKNDLVEIDGKLISARKLKKKG